MLTDKLWVDLPLKWLSYFAVSTNLNTPLTVGVKDLLAKHPERIIEKAVKGMLPKTKLGAAVLRNLKVYVGTEHKHEAQQPTAINLNDLK